jgi:transposase
VLAGESVEPGKPVPMVARLQAAIPGQPLHWRKLYRDGSLSAVSAGEQAMPASGPCDAVK